MKNAYKIEFLKHLFKFNLSDCFFFFLSKRKTPFFEKEKKKVEEEEEEKNPLKMDVTFKMNIFGDNYYLFNFHFFKKKKESD